MTRNDLFAGRFSPKFLRLAGVSVAALMLSAGYHVAAAETPKKPANQLYTDSRVKSFDRFSVEVTGTGADVLLIPGLGCSREVWHRTADRLRGHCTLHILQLAGFAGEPAGANATGPVVDPIVEAIDGYIIAAKLGPATVIGHSLGGTIGMRLSQQHPAEVKKLLLVDSLPFYGVLIGGPAATTDSVKPTATAFKTQMGAPPTDASRAQSKATIERMVNAPADVDLVAGWSAASDRAVMAQAIYDDMTLDMRPGLAAMPMPVTLIYPFNEKAGVPLAAWDDLYHTQFDPVPHKTLVRVDDSKHFVMYDQPAKFDTALDRFLEAKE